MRVAHAMTLHRIDDQPVATRNRSIHPETTARLMTTQDVTVMGRRAGERIGEALHSGPPARVHFTNLEPHVVPNSPSGCDMSDLPPALEIKRAGRIRETPHSSVRRDRFRERAWIRWQDCNPNKTLPIEAAEIGENVYATHERMWRRRRQDAALLLKTSHAIQSAIASAAPPTKWSREKRRSFQKMYERRKAGYPASSGPVTNGDD